MIKIARRKTTLAFALSMLTPLVGASLLATATPVRADDYPSKIVRIVVPYSPGGASDAIARMVGEELGKKLGKKVLVENKPGAGGNIGADYVAKADPDGHTLLLAAAGFMTAAPSMYKNLPFDPAKDYQPLLLLVHAPLLVVVNPDVEVKSLQDFIDLAKSKPGEVTIGNGGVGTAQHLGAEYFASYADIKVNHIAYKGSAPATVDLISGIINAQLDNLVTLIPHIKTERLRPIAVTSAKRVSILPDVPTATEAGLKGFETGTWYGLVGPAGMPAPIVAKLNAALLDILQQPEISKRLLEQGLEPSGGTPEAFSELINEGIARNAKIIKAAGIEPQ